MKRSDIPELHKIPVAELPGSFSVDVHGQVWRVRPPKARSNQSPLPERLTAMTLTEAIEQIGPDRALRDKFPMQLMPGVWWMRWGGDLDPPRWLGQSSLQDFLCQHAIGTRRVHPDAWPAWPALVHAASAELKSSDHKGWFVLNRRRPDVSPNYQAWAQGTQEPGRPFQQRQNHFPMILLGRVIFEAILASRHDWAERTA